MPCRPRTLRELYEDALAALEGLRTRHVEALALVASLKRRCRLCLAVALGFALLTPARVGVPPEAVEEVDPVGIHQPPADALARSQRLPEAFPENWQRGNCPKRKTRRLIRGVCFVVLAEVPPCEDGYEEAGECVSPVIRPTPIPSSIGR